jgi:hypothetical protein
MTRRLILDDELEHVRARPQREQDDEAAQLAALDSIAMPDLGDALPAPLGHEGEARDAIDSATPQAPADPEASSATAHTPEGSWDDATADRHMDARAAPSGAELDALDAMSRPEAAVRADDSMSPGDDSPDALHAMAGRPDAPRLTSRSDSADPWERARGGFVSPMPHPDGELVEGNIDLDRRPVVHNPDGSISTVRSMSFGDDEGERLVPTVSDDGRIMEPQEALAESRRTGRHLGIFDTPEHATEYAHGLHEDQAEQYAPHDRDAEDWGMATDADPVLPGHSRDEAAPEFTYETGDPSELDALDVMAGKPPRDAARDEAAGPLPTLDEGLPTEGEIQTARDWDVPRSILRSLQNGLLGAIGRPRREYEGEGDALQAQRDEGMLDRTRAKGTQHRQEVADAASAEQRAAQEARAQEGLDIRREGLDVQRSRVEAQREATDALTQQRTASAQHTATLDEIARASRADREDPTSPISQGAQNAVRASLAALPQSMRERLTASIGDVSTMSAAELEGVVRRLQTIGVRGTGGGSGTGTGPASSGTLAQTLVDRGIASSPEEAAQLLETIGGRGVRQAIQQDIAPAARARTGTDEQGDEILPGVRAGLELPAGRLRSMQDRLTTYRDGARALGEIETLLGGHGAGTVINPALLAEIEPSLVTLRAMVAQIQGTGIINPGERPLIDATLPDPSSLSGWTLGRLAAAMRGWRRRLDGATSSVLESAGVDDEGIDRGVQYMHGHRSPSVRHSSAPSVPTATPTDAPTDGHAGQVLYVGPSGRRAWGPPGASHPGWTVVDGP